ncbi:WFDC3 [Mytilus edulis]|uniref:WFDC3 n=1 Tax=Mytilus edulis TaxID=6550 RepID=A0A8S3TFN6_MYTED|nr:WFDC3 [Mytilus edulis]
MNVLTAWESCVNGTGVTVGVVDNGIQDHTDLNIDRNLNAGYTNKSKLANPSRRDPYLLLHGEDNIKHHLNVRIASSSVFETFNASLLAHQSDVIDVYSCSFANFHTGTKTYPLTPSQEIALQEGTTNHNLRKLPNGEACSAMMVAAFTTRPGVKKSRGTKVITTDIGNNTTLHFNQNFAAAPMVSGAVALALSANPSLTYRDIMHLLVNTARVSSYFGFGLLDIGALVDRSKTWELVPVRQSCHSTEIVDNPTDTVDSGIAESNKFYNPSWQNSRSDDNYELNYKGTVKSVKLLIHGYSCGNKCKLQPAQQEVQSGECPLAPLLISRCVEQCSNDSDCSVNQKCCYNGCGHSCEMSKTKVQSGECPVPSRLISRCVEQCSTDSDCSVKQKCCDNGCGHSCENSTTYPTKETIRATSEQGKQL